MSTALIWIVQLLSLFLRTIKDHEDCPDGVCDEPLAKAKTVNAELRKPNVSSAGFGGLFGIFKLWRCIPRDRVMKVVERVQSLFDGCEHCPDGECSIFDLLGCLDLQEAASIVGEILDIIRDSKICIDGSNSNDEITLGQAAG